MKLYSTALCCHKQDAVGATSLRLSADWLFAENDEDAGINAMKLCKNRYDERQGYKGYEVAVVVVSVQMDDFRSGTH